MDDSSRVRRINRWGLNPLFQDRYHTWEELEVVIASLATTTEKGDAFEQLCYFYFLYHRDIYGIAEVWCDKVRGREIPSELREKYRLEKKDYGVDGLSLLTSGGAEGWQAKFHSDRSSPTASELATFWAEAEYTDSRRVIANCTILPFVAGKKIGHQQTLLDRLVELDDQFFEALYSFAHDEIEEVIPPRYTPRPHQQLMISSVVDGLQTHDRGKLIAACGVGKTLVALWVTEHESLNASKILVLSPSIALVGQTLREWVLHRSKPFAHLCVCSDEHVQTDLEEGDEIADITIDQLDFAVTTDAEHVTRWLEASAAIRQYIFSTYHSVPVIEQALKARNDPGFDIIVFDEAHRTVGRSDQTFTTALYDDRVPSRKRLFMTATERLINPRLKSLAEKAGQAVVSMGDEEKYGPILYEYNFGKAIQDGVIADYEIILVEVTDQAEQELVEANALLHVEARSVGEEPLTIGADDLLKAGFLVKAIGEGQVSKVITFHSLQKRAKAFSKHVEMLSARLPELAVREPYIAYVLGDQNSAQRAERISAFEQAQAGVLSNVQVLSEGVDIPLIDSVYFVDPKTSLIDLVQAIGRALRKPYDSTTEKVAHIIVPVHVPEGAESLDDIDWDVTLETFHSVIQAMRDQDQRLAEEINQINLYATTGGRSGHSVNSRGNIRVLVPSVNLTQKIDLQAFIDKINLRIATANANPEGARFGFSHLGKGQRKSPFVPKFGILGDYNPEIYQSSLVDPTLTRFLTNDAIVSSKSLKVNNNNVSHTKRLGLIRPIDPKQVQLTDLGRALKDGRLAFTDVFKNQMLLYNTEIGIHPYRLLLQVLLEVGYLSHIEFLYGPYIIQREENGRLDVNGAIARVAYIRQHFPNIELTNLDNREQVRQELNSISPVDIPHEDVWGDRLTTANKFRYAKNALDLFDFIDGADRTYTTPIKIKPGREEDVKRVLELSNPTHAPVTDSAGRVIDFYGTWYWLA